MLYKCAHLCESRDGASYIECINSYKNLISWVIVLFIKL
jgi:hypothetical protein